MHTHDAAHGQLNGTGSAGGTPGGVPSASTDAASAAATPGGGSACARGEDQPVPVCNGCSEFNLGIAATLSGTGGSVRRLCSFCYDRWQRTGRLADMVKWFGCVKCGDRLGERPVFFVPDGLICTVCQTAWRESTARAPKPSSKLVQPDKGDPAWTAFNGCARCRQSKGVSTLRTFGELLFCTPCFNILRERYTPGTDRRAEELGELVNELAELRERTLETVRTVLDRTKTLDGAAAAFKAVGLRVVLGWAPEGDGRQGIMRAEWMSGAVVAGGAGEKPVQRDGTAWSPGGGA